jgi:DNA (cytosine-5)-methyltransferase 1
VNVLSLFAGIGGIELGLERAGMKTVGQVEINPWCRAILAKHWPEVPQHDNVLTTPEWWLSRDRPTVHVVAGGFPCQPFSLAGKQLGRDDPRWLWPAMADVIRAVRPLYVLVENVSALVRDSWAWGTVLADLHALGFDAEWATLRASDFGAPHNRERVYLVAYAAGVDGESRDRLVESGERRASFPVGGLSGLAVPERRRAAREWLDSEPRVDRLADGIPNQVDRLFGLGNAVVPAIPEHIGRVIMAEHEPHSADTD